MTDGIEPTEDAYWEDPRPGETSACPACGFTHDIDFYPINEPVEVGPANHGAFTHPDASVIAAGVCHADESIVLIYGEGWLLKDAYTLDAVCDCEEPTEDEADDRFCGDCKAPLPETDYLFNAYRGEAT